MNKRDFLKGLILFFPAGGVLGALAGELGAKEAAPAQTGTASRSTSASAATGASRRARRKTTCCGSRSSSARGSSGT